MTLKSGDTHSQPWTDSYLIERIKQYLAKIELAMRTDNTEDYKKGKIKKSCLDI